jgi:hypothetical protein
MLDLVKGPLIGLRRVVPDKLASVYVSGWMKETVTVPATAGVMHVG